MKGGLGRGLSALIPAKKTDAAGAPAVHVSAPPPGAKEIIPESDRILHVSVGDILPNPFQPRTEFHAEALDELVSSIKEYGVLQPLVVTEKPNGMFELIAGERRLRASKAAGLKKVPVIIRAADEQKKLELALIENIQRADLSPMEEARAYAQLIEEFRLTQEDVAVRVGKSRPAVANTLRLLKLPDEMQKALSDGRISMSMARVLCGMEAPSERHAMFERMLEGDFNVRQAEVRARTGKAPNKVRAAVKDVNLMAVEEELRGALGTKVEITRRGEKGRIAIDFYSGEELDHLVDRLRR